MIFSNKHHRYASVFPLIPVRQQYMVLICPIIAGVHFDNLAKVLICQMFPL